MNYLIKNLKASEKYKNIINKNKGSVKISGLIDVYKSVIISAIKSDLNKKIAIITNNEIQAKKIKKDLEFLGEKVVFFPKKEISIYDQENEANEILFERISVLNELENSKNIVVITTIESIIQSMIPRKDLYKNELDLNVLQNIEYKEIQKIVELLGYKKVNLIEGRGQYSLRGDILDIGIDNKSGIRIEFWGDVIDSIRIFNIQSQRTLKNIEKINIFPAHENILVRDLSEILKDIKEIYPKEIKDHDIIQNLNYRTKIDKYFNQFYKNQETFLDYISEFTIFVDNYEKILQRKNSIINDVELLTKSLYTKEKFVPELLKNILDKKIDLTNIDYFLENSYSNENCLDLREINIYKNEISVLRDIVNEKNKSKILILTDSNENSKKINEEIPNSIIIKDLDDISINKGSIFITEGGISSGFENYDTDLVVLSSNDFFDSNKKKKKSKLNDSFKKSEKIIFADMKIGDIVVHKENGIGIFLGVQTIQNDGITKDYLRIKYRDDDILYVPIDSLENVRKYIGGEGNIRLNKLGTKEWNDTKAKVRKNLQLVAKELIELYAKRERATGYAFSKDTDWQEQFEASFPFAETEDQLRCIREVKSDMEKFKPMDRLLCGDVGFGKTEVAIRAAFKAAIDGKQVAYLAPTTILANQQYNEFKERMKNFPVEVDLLNRFRTKKEQKETVKNITDNKVDIVIGTHRILSKDINFANLGLLIIDEEQRFGVKAKEKIKEFKENIDVLTMTATPIPRTLQMSVVGIRDMSVIYEPPQNRKPVQTYVLEYDDDIIREAILKELERNGQVFYLFNSVEEIERKAIQLASLVPEAKISFAHGRMSGSEIEAIMQDFIDKKINLLICTTILESGIDIPNANTLIVENADRFGLAQLYQIRGRVGRSNRQAYAFITYKKNKMISSDAENRLKAIKEFTELGSGFKIATRDLQIRGAGSLFGEVQSGHLEQIGYDMYTKILDEVVREEKGEKIDKKEDIQIDLFMDSYIPDEFISDVSQKIEVYQTISAARTEKEFEEAIDTIIDIYGNIPKEVYNLIDIVKLKNKAREKNIVKIQERQSGITIIFAEDTIIKGSTITKILDQYKNKINLIGLVNKTVLGKPSLLLKVGENKMKELTEFIENFEVENDNNK